MFSNPDLSQLYLVGGILADDMGLGKTLTMISLIVRQKELDPPPPASSDIWLSKTVKIKRSAGTLVVCPASVVGKQCLYSLSLLLT